MIINDPPKMVNVHICSPQTVVRIAYHKCPTCKCKRRFTLWDTGFSYYSSHMTCWGCGDSWSDGEMTSRPFMPKWREKSKQEARKDYKERGISRKEAVKWMKKSMEEFING